MLNVCFRQQAKSEDCKKILSGVDNNFCLLLMWDWVTDVMIFINQFALTCCRIFGHPCQASFPFPWYLSTWFSSLSRYHWGGQRWGNYLHVDAVLSHSRWSNCWLCKSRAAKNATGDFADSFSCFARANNLLFNFSVIKQKTHKLGMQSKLNLSRVDKKLLRPWKMLKPK